MNQANENAIQMLAREVTKEFKKLPKAKRKDDLVKRGLINKQYVKLHGVISRAMFVHYIAKHNGLVSDA